MSGEEVAEPLCGSGQVQAQVGPGTTGCAGRPGPPGSSERMGRSTVSGPSFS